MRQLIISLLLPAALHTLAQPQIDVRALLSARLEKKITPDISATFMGAALLTYDLQEVGFTWADAGLKYRLTRNVSLNANYRLFFRRNLDNFYDTRHILYADVDLTRGFHRWTLGGTARLQALFYTHIIEGYRRPLLYNRDRINVKYKINYYWQPFAEWEVFFPLNHPARRRLDQVRGSIGIGYTFNQYVKVEIYEQWQRQLDRRIKNTNYLTAVNWYFRF